MKTTLCLLGLILCFICLFYLLKTRRLPYTLSRKLYTPSGKLYTGTLPNEAGGQDLACFEGGFENILPKFLGDEFEHVLKDLESEG